MIVTSRPSGGSRPSFTATSTRSTTPEAEMKVESTAASVWPAPFQASLTPTAEARPPQPFIFASRRPSGARRVVLAAASVPETSNAPPSTPPPVPEEPQAAPSPAGGPKRKLAVITGGNTGIGFVCAKTLAEQGYDVILGCRSTERGDEAVKRLAEAVPAASFKNWQLTLDDLSSVKDFYKRAQDEGLEIDVLLNNAGVMACPEAKTKQGLEYQLGVNHMGHYVLTSGLLPLLADPARSSRIVTVSSAAHYFGDIRFEDPNFKEGYNEWTAYAQSKLANAFFAFELANRLPEAANITSNCLHPGVVNTELARHIKPQDPNVIQTYFTPIFEKALGIRTPEDGAQTSILLASSPEVEGVTGKYYDENGTCMVANWRCYVPGDRAKFWDLSSEMTGESFDVEALVKSAGASVAV